MGNIEVARSIAEIIRTCLGPRAMLKMLLDPMGTVVLTNDGHAILREIDMGHPAAKTILEVCRAQDEEVGDGTTSVVVLLGEMLAQAAPFLSRRMHPLTIIAGYQRALNVINERLPALARSVDVADGSSVMDLLRASLNTKLGSRWSDLVCGMVLQAVRCVFDSTSGKTVIDVKRFARIERIPGGDVGDSRFISGCILNKDVIHASMPRSIRNPRILLVDCPLEYKKGESQTAIEISQTDQWQSFLESEETQVQQQVEALLALKPDLIITEKGVSGIDPH